MRQAGARNFCVLAQDPQIFDVTDKVLPCGCYKMSSNEMTLRFPKLTQ